MTAMVLTIELWIIVCEQRDEMKRDENLVTYTRFKSPIVSFSYCQYARCKGITQRDLDVNRRKCETDQTKLRLTHVHRYTQQRVQTFCVITKWK